MFPLPVRQENVDFLRESQARLANALSFQSMERLLSRLHQASGEPSASLLKDCAVILGVSSTGQSPLPPDRINLASQFLAMTAGLWDNPAQAMLYSASQAASHRVLRQSLGETEPSITTAFCEELRSTLGRDFIRPLWEARIVLPPGCHLEFGTASMQGHADRLGADLAVVIGAEIGGIPQYRVALLQAKRGRLQGTANVSQGGGEQLRQILETGMGFYLFYPKKIERRVFCPRSEVLVTSRKMSLLLKNRVFALTSAGVVRAPSPPGTSQPSSPLR